MKHASIAMAVLATLAVVSWSSVAPADDETDTRIVHCDQGETLAHALQQAQPGETIRVTGTCHEAVAITTDRVTLDGEGTAILDGGGQEVLRVDSAHNVTVTGLTVRNGGVGVHVVGGASLVLRNTTVEHNTNQGILITSSQAQLIDSTARNNGTMGIMVVEGASANFLGTVVSHDNFWGIVILGSSTLSAPFGTPATVRTHHNVRDGMLVSGGAQIALLASGQVVDTHDNGGSGLLIASSATVLVLFGSTVDAQHNQVHGIALFASAALNASDGATIRAKGNAQDGIHVAQNTAFGVTIFFGLVPLPQMVEASDNGGHGLSASAGASIAVDSTILTSRQNRGAGLLVDDGSTATLVGTPGTPVTLTENGRNDVILSFGSRATLVGTTIGTLTCDPTVLIRGTVACP
jgi:parallel beta helix pectate lyase-like protein